VPSGRQPATWPSSETCSHLPSGVALRAARSSTPPTRRPRRPGACAAGAWCPRRATESSVPPEPSGTGRPDAAALAAAVERGATVPDVIAPDLLVLFCGINPGRWSGAVGHHFAHPGNRFWKALHLSGFTGGLLAPADERRLLDERIGITNLVARTTAAAADLSAEELRAGAAALERKVRRCTPRALVFLGVGAYRTAFGRSRAAVGRQPERIGDTETWVLPNPSGLQAHYQLDELAAQFRTLRDAVTGRGGGAGRSPAAPLTSRPTGLGGPRP
jgi:TDG/mug DNA glycosylase family protein